MALTKAQAVDRIDVRSPYNHIHIRTATVFQEDGVNLAMRYSKEVKKCGTLDGDDKLVDTDMSAYSAEIQGVAAAVWTTDVKNKYKAALIEAKG
tara:strand:+ start:140 stop:421 length:282 start_codon:yes stop_codon:yes gene_type:complete